jgi:aryl-alcohol dehydrogenase-like predicted oxidoreductase
LSGAIRSRADLEPEDWRLQNPRFTDEAIATNNRLADLVGEIAKELDATAAQVALAWVLSRNASIAAIPGTRKIERLEENWTSQELALRTEHLQRLESMVALGVVGNRY